MSALVVLKIRHVGKDERILESSNGCMGDPTEADRLLNPESHEGSPEAGTGEESPPEAGIVVPSDDVAFNHARVT